MLGNRLIPEIFQNRSWFVDQIVATNLKPFRSWSVEECPQNGLKFDFEKLLRYQRTVCLCVHVYPEFITIKKSRFKTFVFKPIRLGLGQDVVNGTGR